MPNPGEKYKNRVQKNWVWYLTSLSRDCDGHYFHASFWGFGELCKCHPNCMYSYTPTQWWGCLWAGVVEIQPTQMSTCCNTMMQMKSSKIGSHYLLWCTLPCHYSEIYGIVTLANKEKAGFFCLVQEAADASNPLGWDVYLTKNTKTWMSQCCQASGRDLKVCEGRSGPSGSLSPCRIYSLLELACVL